MSYEVNVPDSIRQQITNLHLHPDLEEELYRRLAEDLEYGHETTCFRLAAPSPTYIYNVQLRDPVLRGITHWFVFHLTYGERDDTLYVRQFFHDDSEDWESNPAE